MSDLIRRDEALAGILNHYEVNNEIQNKEMDYCFDMLNSLRAADAVEVVRCSQCVNNPRIDTRTKGMVWCRKFRSEVSPGGFCSYGERKMIN